MSEIKTNLLGFLAPPKNLDAKFTNIFFRLELTSPLTKTSGSLNISNLDVMVNLSQTFLKTIWLLSQELHKFKVMAHWYLQWFLVIWTISHEQKYDKVQNQLNIPITESLLYNAWKGVENMYYMNVQYRVSSLLNIKSSWYNINIIPGP